VSKKCVQYGINKRHLYSNNTVLTLRRTLSSTLTPVPLLLSLTACPIEAALLSQQRSLSAQPRPRALARFLLAGSRRRRWRRRRRQLRLVFGIDRFEDAQVNVRVVDEGTRHAIVARVCDDFVITPFSLLRNGVKRRRRRRRRQVRAIEEEVV